MNEDLERPPHRFIQNPVKWSHDALNSIGYLLTEKGYEVRVKGIYLFINGIRVCTVEQTGEKTLNVGNQRMVASKKGFNWDKILGWVMFYFQEKSLKSSKEMAPMAEVALSKVSKAPIGIQDKQLKDEIDKAFPDTQAWQKEAIYAYRRRLVDIGRSIALVLEPAGVDNWDACVSYAETILREQGLEPPMK